MKKAETLARWKAQDEGQEILPHFTPIPYKSKGSTYGACGIRIDGNPEFVDAVMSRIKDLIAGENHATRLTLSRNKVDGKGLDKSFHNQDTAAECCYIRLHVRGHEGSTTSAVFDRHLDCATEAYATAIKA